MQKFCTNRCRRQIEEPCHTCVTETMTSSWKVCQIHLGDTVLPSILSTCSPGLPRPATLGTARTPHAYLWVVTRVINVYPFHSKCPQSSNPTTKATSGLSQSEVNCSLCGTKNSRCCSGSAALQVLSNSAFLKGIYPVKINVFYQEQKELNTPQSLNYLGGMYDIPTKNTPQILTSFSHYPAISLFHKDQK